MHTTIPVGAMTPKDHLIEAFKASGCHYLERTEDDVTWLFVGDDLVDSAKFEGFTRETIPLRYLQDESKFRLNNFEFDATDDRNLIQSCG